MRAVLFDVGGPLNTEVTHEATRDRQIIEALTAQGIHATQAEFGAAAAWAVESFAPNTYRAILWRLSAGRPDAQARLSRVELGGPPPFELRDGIEALLARLHARGVLLGLAANQPATTVQELDAVGIGKYFSHREVSGTHGYAKPDPRLFLRACEDLGVGPAECVMVGDRIDNDIAPARLLGMRTVLFRTGRHARQMPRWAEEAPDREVDSVEALGAALDTLL